MGLAVTTVGACRKILDLTVAHVKQRHQFGVPIGSFQAVKHKAADMYLAIRRARVLAYSALTIAEDDPRQHRAAVMAKAAMRRCQKVVYRNGATLRRHGLHLGERTARVPEGAVAANLLLGLGQRRCRRCWRWRSPRYGERHQPRGREVPRRVRRVPRRAPCRPQRRLRERTRSSSHRPRWSRRWQRTLFDAGWLLPGQPPEYGGRNTTLEQVLAHQEELSRRRIYHGFNPQGLGIIGASLLTFGTAGAEAEVGHSAAPGSETDGLAQA